MKLALIYNTWDEFYLLECSINHMRPLVDMVIVIYSRTSNYGEIGSGIDGSAHKFPLGECPIFFLQHEPDLKKRPNENETDKRNAGLKHAIELHATHFLMADSDEFYEHDPFLKEKERFLNPNLKGLVCASQVYFKSPKLTIGLDTTLVTFIHKLEPNIRFEMNRNFPFAWDKMRQIRIDPTRQLNINSGVEWSDIICHHYSWCRKDFEKKIRNSTARANIERSTIRQDLALAKEGYFCKFYGKTLIRASVDFNISDVQDENIQSLEAGVS